MTDITTPWGYVCDDCRRSTTGRCWQHAIGIMTSAITWRFWFGVTVNGRPILVANR